MDISWGGSSCPMFPSITQILKVGFSGGRKTWGAWAKPSEKGQQTTTNTTYKCRNVTQALAVGGVCHSCTCSLGNPSSKKQNIDCNCTHHLLQWEHHW